MSDDKGPADRLWLVLSIAIGGWTAVLLVIVAVSVLSD